MLPRSVHAARNSRFLQCFFSISPGEFPSLPVDDSHEDPDVISDIADEYSFQDEAEDIASTSYDNSAIADDFNYSNRAVVYQDVLDQPSYVQYCYQNYLYPDLNPSALSSVSAPASELDKKMMPFFQHAKQNCPNKADECQYSHDRAVIKAYLDTQHAKVTGSKKAIHDKTKETFKALNKSSSFRPSQSRPTISSISNTPAIPTILLSPIVLDVNWSCMKESSVSTVSTF